MKSIYLPVWLTAILAVPAFGMVGPSVEFPLATPTIGRAAGMQMAPQVATDGRDFFAVWIDSRSGGTYSIYGTRVLADGTVLDPTGILISTPGHSSASAALAWDGSNYVVVWEDTGNVSFVRVDRNGTVLDAPRTAFSQSQKEPVIASNGHGSIVSVFGSAGFELAGISQDGSVTKKASFYQGGNLRIASNGDGYLLSLSNFHTDLYRLDDNGDLVAGSTQQLMEANYSQLAATPGGKYLLVGGKWATSGTGACLGSIVGRFVSSTGVSQPFVIHDADGPNIQDIEVTPDGNGFQVAWTKRVGTIDCPGPVQTDPPISFAFPPFSLAYAHVSPDGSSTTPSTLVEGTEDLYVQEPAVASNGTAKVFVWIEVGNARPTPKVAAAIAFPGEQIVSIPIASSAATQWGTTVAAAENMFMTAWFEERDNVSRAIYARRFGTDGRPLDTAPIRVSADTYLGLFTPAISFDGSVWLFVWSGDYRTMARRMAADGTWIDAAPFTIGPPPGGQFEYALASNGNGFAVLIITPGPVVTMAFVPRAGDVRLVKAAIDFSTTRYLTFPSVAWDGSAYVAVWEHGDSSDIEGVRLDQNGQVITPLFGIARTSRVEFNPSIACHEGTCAIAWVSDNAIAAARLIGGTPVAFNTLIAPSAPNTSVFSPKVVATPDGGFQLFWSEYGSPTSASLTASITPTGIDSISDLNATGFTAAAMNTRGQLALALAHPDYDTASGGVMRAFLRLSLTDGRRRAVRR